MRVKRVYGCGEGGHGDIVGIIEEDEENRMKWEV